jgi:hypothetical protein
MGFTFYGVRVHATVDFSRRCRQGDIDTYIVAAARGHRAPADYEIRYNWRHERFETNLEMVFGHSSKPGDTPYFDDAHRFAEQFHEALRATSAKNYTPHLQQTDSLFLDDHP